MPPAAKPPQTRTRPVFSGTSRTLLRGRFQPTPRGYHCPRPEKEKGGPFLFLGPPPSNKLRAFFLFCCFSLIFSGGACGWLRAARRGTPARLRRSRLPACPSRG